ncbi:MAG: DUF2066 domain-containing protein [Gammaproteobacteria bacterium]|nr:MAG: DUF2066 domain-containing protein [Gammaproteobacteria bacterium]
MIHISGDQARTALLLLLLVMAGLPGGAGAAQVADLYAASVPASEAATSGNAAAFTAALRQVLVKVSGRQAAAEPAVLAAFADPAALVQQYRRDPAGAYWVQFDPAAIRRGLAAAGLPAWSGDRPATLVWLAYDNGAGERDIVAGSDEAGVAGTLRQQLLDAAAARGIPLLLPLRDSQELAELGAADVWGEFTEPIRRASARYQADVILVGRARLFPPGLPDVRWTLLDGAERADWRGSVADGPGGLAERLASRAAAAPEGPGRIGLAVSGLRDFTQYGGLLGYLAGLEGVQSVGITGIRGDVLRLDLQLRAGREAFARQLAMRRILEPETAAGQGDGTLYYRLVGQP